MPTGTLTTEQIITLLADVAVMRAQLKKLTDEVADQEAEIKKLVLLAERGKGSFWMLITAGGIVGALITNIRTITSFFEGK